MGRDKGWRFVTGERRVDHMSERWRDGVTLFVFPRCADLQSEVGLGKSWQLHFPLCSAFQSRVANVSLFDFELCSTLSLGKRNGSQFELEWCRVWCWMVAGTDWDFRFG